MAEISFPFTKDNDGGGRQAVGQTDWQSMAQMWGGDRVATRLTSSSYTGAALPFAIKVVGDRTVEISPGEAWVGGFYYRLDAPIAFDIGANFDPAKDRRDTVVLRADIPRGSVNMTVVQGQPSANPIAVQPRRKAGQEWELVIHELKVPRANGRVEPFNRAPFDMPNPVAFPWNAGDSAAFMPVGTFVYDLDSDARHVQQEHFRGRDGLVPSMTLGKSSTYTPQLINAASDPKGLVCRGRWRWIAPNTCWFSVDYRNDSDAEIRTKQDALSFQLPVPLNGSTGQAFTGYMLNVDERGGLPNFVALTGMAWAGHRGQTVKITSQSANSLRDGLDYLLLFPPRASIVFSGVYEANQFNE
ncbi:hypothetical protein IPZ58_05190 [Streptomyces roseoverticillatus]|uniref:hypothetical protein n=1 Tax=Streptomyces roseoverticillatus TaxID=66429 RepID=UPI001F2C3ECF|nr:hypothetical protein [Streptomyces roseoverticillatus]MCF3100969.1 hypothetical protein [Streptomyces roseoverticillatus]